MAPVALFTRGTRTHGWYVVALAQAHLRIQPTLIVAHRQHTVTLRVSTSGPIARSLNRKSCHSAIGADLLQLRNWTVLDHAVCHLFILFKIGKRNGNTHASDVFAGASSYAASLKSRVFSSCNCTDLYIYCLVSYGDFRLNDRSYYCEHKKGERSCNDVVLAHTVHETCGGHSCRENAFAVSTRWGLRRCVRLSVSLGFHIA